MLNLDNYLRCHVTSITKSILAFSRNLFLTICNPVCKMGRIWNMLFRLRSSIRSQLFTDSESTFEFLFYNQMTIMQQTCGYVVSTKWVLLILYNITIIIITFSTIITYNHKYHDEEISTAALSNNRNWLYPFPTEVHSYKDRNN